MAYSHEIDLLLARLSQDKGIHPKWRNKAVARLEEAQAFINQGLRGDIAEPDLGASAAALVGSVCICRPGTINNNCPIHGKGK